MYRLLYSNHMDLYMFRYMALHYRHDISLPHPKLHTRYNSNNKYSNSYPSDCNNISLGLGGKPQLLLGEELCS